MRNIVIASMFKNESMVIKEWIEHYIKEGIEHFYLIDNGSDDNYLDIIQPYLNIVTLIKDPYRKKLGTQDELLNKYFLEKIKEEATWVLVVDMDEYVYSRNTFKNISDYIKSIPEDISQIILPWKMFGSSNLIYQPSNIISSFTMKEDSNKFLSRIKTCHAGHSKTITRTKRIINLSTHRSSISSGECVFSDLVKYDTFKNYDIDKQHLHINHYTHMSYEYYTTIKINRGGGQGGSYDLIKFKHESSIFNEIEDSELKNKIYTV